MTRLQRLDAPAGFELWSADLRSEPSAHERALLSEDEHERAARFVFERDRRRYVASRASLRRLLAQRLNADAAALRLDAGAHGKPALRDAPRCAFNLSHSEDVAWIALADGGEIGVDVEVLREVADAHDLARRNYTPAECAQLDEAEPGQRDLAFLRCWTRKEAVLKAIGSGFSIAPETFEAGADAAPRVVTIDTDDGRAEVRLYTHAPEAMPHVIGALARRV